MSNRIFFKDEQALMKYAKPLEGKTLRQVGEEIERTDAISRVISKGDVGYIIENAYFGIEKNPDAQPDIPNLGIEIKTFPLKFNKKRDRLSVKEPLSLNIVDYDAEDKRFDITESSLYKKNRKILFIVYIHDDEALRSQYVIKYVFLWEMNPEVLDELREDYKIIKDKIRKGMATDLHQKYNKYLTTCPKHSGTFKDPDCRKSKRKQPHSEVPAEIRAFRLKVSYMNLIISRYLGKELGKGGWEVEP